MTEEEKNITNNPNSDTTTIAIEDTATTNQAILRRKQNRRPRRKLQISSAGTFPGCRKRNLRTLNYIVNITEIGFGSNPLYRRSEAGIADLFFALHRDRIRYVEESGKWFTYDGCKWSKNGGDLKVAEMCKDFTQALSDYVAIAYASDEVFINFVKKQTTRRCRERILVDARSIAPVSLTEFDRDMFLLNCQNGTLNLETFELQHHTPNDLITKMVRADYVENAKCERWDQFVDEIMCSDAETAVYLQKAFGYALTGSTEYEEFFILYGNKSRNGKSTLTETVGFILGDYAVTAQPQTFSHRSAYGSAPSPDMARLKGARLVNMPEPEKGLELNSALIKQLTGGDTYTGRFLFENPFEFTMTGKIFVNTNHLPRVSDDTVFASGRAKVIPFERHFTEDEQDKHLKCFFRCPENMSAILNWMVRGYKLILEDGFEPSHRVKHAVAAYRHEADTIGIFLAECTRTRGKSRLSTSLLFSHYAAWAKRNGYKHLDNRSFVGELRRRLDIKRDCAKGNVAIGIELSSAVSPHPDEKPLSEKM